MRTRPNLRKTIAAGKKSGASESVKIKGEEAARLLPKAVNKPFKMEEAVQARKDLLKSGASELRMPGEPIAGAGFYFKGNEELRNQIAGTDIPLKTAAQASARLSGGTTPEKEK